MFHTKYNHCKPRNFHTDKPSSTDPQYRDDCDINVVVSKFLRGAGLDSVNIRKGTYGDVSQFGDFTRMMEIVHRGTSAFMDIPSDIRARFGNDPKAFYSFVCDPSNADRLVEMGLAEYFKPDDGVVQVRVVNPTPDKNPPLPNT